MASNPEIKIGAQHMVLSDVLRLLSQTYWASGRSAETIRRSMDNSVCFGVFIDGVQVGFARVITDYATTYYLADVIIDENHRGRGYGKALISAITAWEPIVSLWGILVTRDADGLYKQFGFGSSYKGIFMSTEKK